MNGLLFLSLAATGRRGDATSGGAAARWASELHFTCELLHRVDPGLISAISITRPFETSGPSEWAAAREMTRRLSEEFGLTGSVSTSGKAVSVRFARRQRDGWERGPAQQPDA